MKRRLAALAILTAALVLSLPALGAQVSGSSAAPIHEAITPLDATQKGVVVETLATTLEKQYVVPEIGALYAARLREQLQRGAYDSLTGFDTFSDALTADLQAVAPDKHLRVSPSNSVGKRSADTAGVPNSTKASGPVGLEDARMIGDVAYLRFNEFPGGASADNARSFLLAHADARAVVIDSRPNRGGRLNEINAILPLLFNRPTTLYRMELRPSLESPFQTIPMVNAVAGSASIQRWDHTIVPDIREHRLQAVPVYYLVSRRTASAAEALALGFKDTHRATLIGETTAGADYFGRIYEVGNDALRAWISIGRTYDPKTGWDWEGKGIEPDVKVPVDDALTVALDLARRAGAHPGA